MSVVVVYESMYGNTHRIADAIGLGLVEAGAPAQILSVEEVRGRGLDPGDVLVVDAPTHVHGLSRATTRQGAVQDAPGRGLEVDPSAPGEGVREWLDALGTHGGRAAAFDTGAKGPAVLTGRASQKIARALHQHGFDLVAEPESFLVSSDDRLLPDEATWARQWGADLATAIRASQL